MDTNVGTNTATEPEPSSATPRRNVLVWALFSTLDSEQSLTSPSPPPTDKPTTSSSVLPVEQPPLIKMSTSSHSLREVLLPSSASVNIVIPTPSSAMEPLNQQHELVKGV
jgi:hypothetical protein